MPELSPVSVVVAFSELASTIEFVLLELSPLFLIFDVLVAVLMLLTEFVSVDISFALLWVALLVWVLSALLLWIVVVFVLATGCVLVVSPVELGVLTCVWALVVILPVVPWILLDGACPLPDGVPPLFPELFEVVLCWLGVPPKLPPLLLALPPCDVFPTLELSEDELLEVKFLELLLSSSDFFFPFSLKALHDFQPLQSHHYL